MPQFQNRCNLIDLAIGTHNFRVLTLKQTEVDNLKNRLIEILPVHYLDPQSLASTLKRLGKPEAAEKLLVKMPETKRIRSGDIGEILTSEYIQECTNYSNHIFKLRWKDHREMAMRGDDVIGILIDQQQTIRFLKAEGKSTKALSTATLEKARQELDQDDGLPSQHALSFVSDRLREMGKDELSDFIEDAQLVKGIRASHVEHLLFTFTASNPETLQKEALKAYQGSIKQISVGFRVTQHQELIASVYQGVIDAYNN